MTIRNLERAFEPKSVAVIGASAREGSVGHTITRNLKAAFKGRIDLVNPKYDEILGLACVPDVAALAAPPDLAVLAVPPAAGPGIIAALAEKGNKAAVVITAGFGKGPGSLAQAMLDAARPATLRIIGPNCLGLIVPPAGLDASFAHARPETGDIALVSQSGAIITSVIDWANARGIGFSALVSIGDMADVDFGDLLDYLAADVRTRSIMLYIEAVTDARKFMSAARAAARTKPVVVVKAGRHAEAAKAAASHTGALAGVDAVYDAAFHRAGLLRVLDLDELFSAVETLGHIGPFSGDRLAVVTNGGGIGVMAVDRLVDFGGRLASLSEETMAALDAVLPPTWSKANPVDIIGDAGPERYRAALEAVLADAGVDAVMAMNCPTALASSAEAAGAVAETVAAAAKTRLRPKPVFAAWVGEATAEAGQRLLEDKGIPSFSTPATAVRGFMHLVRHARAQDALMRTPESLPRDFAADMAGARAVVAEALAAGQDWLDAPQMSRLLSAYAIPVAEAIACADPEAAAVAAGPILERYGGAVVKVFSPDIQHKSDIGGVRLDLKSPADVRQAATEVLAAAAKARPDARLDGVTVHPMVRREGARELILGLADDPVFGPVVLFGQGGTAVEVVQDKALALPPLDLTLAHDLIERTRVARLLHAFRGEPAADIEAVALTLVKLSQLAADVPEIRELDMNPLLADANGVVALDFRVRVAEETARDPHGVNPRFAVRPYPKQLETPMTLQSGRRVLMRPVRPEDEALYDDFFAGIDREDLRLRFFTPVPNLSHAFLARLTQIDYARSMAFVALDADDGALLGVVRLHMDANHERGEYAILVRSDLKGQGLGWRLMERMIAYGRSDGAKEIYGEVLRENTTMLAMCRELGFAEIHDADDASVVRVVLRLAEAPAAAL